MGRPVTLALVGDCISTRPLGPQLAVNPELRGVAELLRGATAAIGNLETSLVDMRGFRGYLRTADDWGLAGSPAVAADLAELGFAMMSRANNHAMDWGADGLRETGRHADAAGIIHAGAGDTLAAARAPRYHDTANGRVALVSMYLAPRLDGDAALDQFGEVPARPGVHAVRVARVATVPTTTYAGLLDLARAAEPDGLVARLGPDAVPEHFDLFGWRFEQGEAAAVRYEPMPGDVPAAARSVRLASQHADVVVAAIHCHLEGPDPDTPPDVLRELATALVEAGAHAVAGHGVHRLWPIELHHGALILYGLGNFIWSDLIEPLQRQLYEEAGVAGDEPLATDADVNRMLNAAWFDGQRFFDSVVAEVAAGVGEATVRLHPVDLGYGLPLTRSGIPQLAEGDRRTAILDRLAELSEPYGVAVAGDGAVRPAAGRATRA